MEEMLSNGEDSSCQGINSIQRLVTRFQNRSIHDLRYLGETDLRQLSDAAVKVGEEGIKVVRPFFRKILFSLPSWSPNPTFIRSHSTLTYTAEGKTIIDEESQMAEKRTSNIKKEVEDGVSPWLAHVKYNQRNIQSPYVVGFYQDEKGKIKKIYGERSFRSQRQVENSFFASRSEAKEVNLLGVHYQRVAASSIRKSEYWNLLPEDLRSRFEGGEILVTGGKDLYELSEGKIEQLAQSNNPKALIGELDQRFQAAPEEYRLLYYSDYRDDNDGRTGVLVRIVKGDIEPITIFVEGKEYVIELKGCGTKSGGFGRMHHRTGRDILTGAVEQEQALNEFDRLSENIGTDKPKPAGSITFDSDGYQQGYIIRLTPSTVRASYSGNEAYPAIDVSENVERVLSMYADELLNQIFAANPKILDRSAHSENLLLWGDGRFTFTDFSDHIAFNDKNYPHDENHGGYMTPKQMLNYYIEMVKEIPGYNVRRHKEYFYKALSKAFSSKDKHLVLNSTDSSKTITQKVWKQGGMAYQVFKARKENQYIAQGALHEFDERINGRHSSSKKDIASESEAVFTEKFQAGLAELRQTMVMLESKVTTLKDKEVLKHGLSLLEQGDLITGEKVMEKVFEIMNKVTGYKSQEDERIRNGFRYQGSLYYTLTPIIDYLEHEKDLINTAKASCADFEKESLKLAEKELKERMAQFVATVRDPHKLYELITDPEQVRRMVTFSFYTR